MSARKLAKAEKVSREVQALLTKLAAWLRADVGAGSTLTPVENAELVLMQHILAHVFKHGGSEALFKFLVAVGGMAGEMFEADAARERQH